MSNPTRLDVGGQQKGKHLYRHKESFPASFLNYASIKQLSLIIMIMIMIKITIMITITIRIRISIRIKNFIGLIKILH